MSTQHKENDDLASNLAARIADEWTGKQEFPEDAVLLSEVLTKLFRRNPTESKKLLGTGILEQNYATDCLPHNELDND